MSWSLAKRGLELFDDDEIANYGSLRKVDYSSKGAVANTNRQGVRKAAKQKKRIKQEQKEFKNQLIQKEVTSAVKRYKDNLPRNTTKKSLKALKRLDGKIGEEHSKKILSHLEKNQEERITKSEWEERSKKKKVDTGSSVFTDEDFEKMNDVWLQLNN